MSEVKISVIMPVYNVEHYLRTAIDSVLMQTLKDIELICVDDASTDGSTDILREYEEKDPRVRVIYLPQNNGSVAARKYAVQKVRGKYIMMLDSDDMFEPNACKTVWLELQRYPVDVLCFATQVTACGDIPASDATKLTEQLNPYKSLIKNDLLSACFKKKIFTHTLWNKAWSTSLCKQAFPCIKDTYRTISDDIYISFILLYFAKSYRGIPDTLHRYYLGRGVSGHYNITQKRFFTLSETCSIYDDLIQFLDSQAAERECYFLVDMMKKCTLEDVVYSWRQQVSIKDAPECYQKMVDDWGVEEIVSQLAKDSWYEWPKLQQRIIHPTPQRTTGKPVKTIGTFYYRMSNGGIERVLSIMIPIWISAGYQVILITEEPGESTDYKLPSNLIRVLIPSRLENTQVRYQNRIAAWQYIIKSYKIDTIVYNAWCDPVLFWDLCTLKGLQTNVIVWAHGAFSHLFRLHDAYRYELIRNYFLVDRTVALSRTFKAFFSNYCPSYYIPNPILLCDEQDRSKKEEGNIVWVGRIDRDKHPEAAIQAFSNVVKEIPNATLTIVGGGESNGLLNELKDLVNNLQLQNHVTFTGFIKDPTKYYKRAALLLFTTEHEGFPMVLAEAKAHALPIVMYDLNYLEMVRDGRGIVTVPFGDITSLSTEICKILSDSDLRCKMGEEARQSAEDFAAFDLSAAWKEVFDSFVDAQSRVNPDTLENSKMLQLLMDESQIGERSVSAGTSNAMFLTEEEDRLLKSKFRKIARIYWYWKDFALRRIRKILKHHP